MNKCLDRLWDQLSILKQDICRIIVDVQLNIFFAWQVRSNFQMRLIPVQTLQTTMEIFHFFTRFKKTIIVWFRNNLTRVQNIFQLETTNTKLFSISQHDTILWNLCKLLLAGLLLLISFWKEILKVIHHCIQLHNKVRSKF